jgi:hypothetical protein
MANTSILRTKVEPVIREALAAEFGQPFSSQILALPGGAAREFDAVSADRRIVVSIKTSSGLTSGGHLPGGKINSCIADLYYLSLLTAPVRRLVLTNPDFFEIFTTRMAGALAPGIEIVAMPLPSDLQRQVDLVIADASREMSRLAPEAIAVAVEDAAESAGQVRE